MAIAFVNALGVFATAGPTSVSNTYAPTSGNFVAVVSCNRGFNVGPSDPTLSDTRGNTIPSATVNRTFSGTNVQGRLKVWLIPNCIGGSGSFSVSTGVADDTGIDVLEYSGVDSAATLDGTPVTNGVTAAASISSGNITTAVSGSMLLGSYFDGGGAHTVTLSGTPTYNQRLNTQEVSDGNTANECDALGNSPGTYSLTVTRTGNSDAQIISVIGIKAAAGAATQPSGGMCGV